MASYSGSSDGVDRAERERLLALNEIDAGAYSLTGGLQEDQYCLEQDGGDQWVVYFVERGIRSDERTFPSEDLACWDLFTRLLADPTTRSVRPADG